MSKSKTTKVFQVEDQPKYSKVNKVYVVNPSEGGNDGGIADEVAWDNVTGKPSTFPPSEHNHDERYYTKGEIDAPGFLANNVDGVTVILDGRELIVRSIDGLDLGIADINDWLAGTSGNIQTQIDGMGDDITAIAGGMKFKTIAEDHADMSGIVNKENGDVVVVLKDETREDGRSMYVYSEDTGSWRFLGAFTFTTKFTALSDTPSDYQNGKYLKSIASGIVYDDVDYQALKNKPESTITAIDGAVSKAHEHGNADDLAKLGVNAEGELTINGVVYAPKDEQQAIDKDYISVALTEGSTGINKGRKLSFNYTHYSNNMSRIDVNTIRLNGGKTYLLNANFVFRDISKYGYKNIKLTDDKGGNIGVAHWARAQADGTTGLTAVVKVPEGVGVNAHFEGSNEESSTWAYQTAGSTVTFLEI